MQILQRNVPVDGRGLPDGESKAYVLAVHPDTGETLWRHIRPTEAQNESQESHTTPIPYNHNGQKLLLIAGGDALTGHDLATGAELWRWGQWNPKRVPIGPLIASPVPGDGVALVSIPKGQPVYAVKTNETGELDDQAIAWSSRDEKHVTTEVPTPAYYDGDFFVLSDSRKNLARLDGSTGKVKWSTPMPASKYEASPLAADGKLYAINFDGQVSILDATDGKVIRQISMDKPAEHEMVRASIIATHGQLLIRTTRTLYCVGKTRGS